MGVFVDERAHRVKKGDFSILENDEPFVESVAVDISGDDRGVARSGMVGEYGAPKLFALGVESDEIGSVLLEIINERGRFGAGVRSASGNSKIPGGLSRSEDWGIESLSVARVESCDAARLGGARVENPQRARLGFEDDSFRFDDRVDFPCDFSSLRVEESHEVAARRAGRRRTDERRDDPRALCWKRVAGDSERVADFP